MKKLELKPTQSVEIDWSKPQWVLSKNGSLVVVLTTGEHSSVNFTGTALPCEAYPNGDCSDTWVKHNFQPVQGEIPFIISNND
jgi:hypothetical protein